MSTPSMILLDAILWFGFAGAAWFVALRYLHFYQQEEYDSGRFLAWWLSQQAFEKRVTLFSILMILASFYIPLGDEAIVAAGVFSVVMIVLGWSNRPANVKKALVMTDRARRIFLVGMVLLLLSMLTLSRVLIQLDVGLMTANALSFALGLIFIPLSICIGNLALFPLEYFVQRGFRSDAVRKLNEIAPTVIGITGSYGKTSTKQILAHILDAHEPTLGTPGSVNTVMGITRVIRERLKPEHRYFISEMGAYGIGSIKRLCDLTPPRIAIVTAVGWAHYERFKSLEAVATAKSELPQSVPEDGFAVLNGDYPHVRGMESVTPGCVYFYGEDVEAGRLDCRIVSSQVTPEGLTCVFEYEGQQHTIQMPVYGKHMVLNAAAAFLTAMKVGVAPVTAIAALRTLPQVDHRLVVSSANGITVIDDAYNSNPVGFANALEVLSVLPGGKKIVVTPGMVELGAREDEEYRAIAPHIAKAADVVLLVAAHRIPALYEALLENGMTDDSVKRFGRLDEARACLDTIISPGDVVLYENDLPDLYENVVPFRLLPTRGSAS